MLVALLAFAGVALTSLGTAGVAIYQIRTVDRHSADTDEVKGLWDENRKIRGELNELRVSYFKCQEESAAMRWRIAVLEKAVNGEQA